MSPLEVKIHRAIESLKPDNQNGNLPTQRFKTHAGGSSAYDLSFCEELVRVWPGLLEDPAYVKLSTKDPYRFPPIDPSELPTLVTNMKLKAISDADDAPEMSGAVIQNTVKRPGVGTAITQAQCITTESDAPPEVFIAAKYSQLYTSARKRGLEFTLTFEDIESLINEKYCYYTGVELTTQGLSRRTAERLDNKVGYVRGNVVACSWSSNQLKNYLFESDQSELRIEPKQLLMMIAKLPRD